MEAKPLVPAAQYVRMSTEDQQYSITNQEAAIRTYAKSRGYVVVSTYADAGKSGIEIKHRKELRRLLSDVMSGRAQFKVILVYDVSRWGLYSAAMTLFSVFKIRLAGCSSFENCSAQ